MDKRIVAALMLCGVSPFCYAKQDCETLAGIAAGEANYLYATANVSADSRLHFYSAPASGCQLPAFLVNSDTVEVLRSSQRYESTGMLSKDEPFVTSATGAQTALSLPVGLPPTDSRR